MRIPLKPFTSLLPLLAMLGAGPAYAYEKGEMWARLGPAVVAPKEDSSVLSVNGTGLAGTGVTVDDDAQLGLTLGLMLTEHLGLELLAATPFEHTITAFGLGSDLDVAKVKHLPPTLSLQYFPFNSGAKFQPYIGLGLNYTVFFSEELTSDFENAMGTGDISLDNSAGLAMQLGFDFQMSDKLFINAAVWKIDISTTGTIDLDAGARIKTDVDIDPIAYMIGLGFRF